MSRIDNPNRGEIDALLKRIKALEKATPLASASVGNGRLRFYAGSQLLIEDGNFTVSGTAEITGTLDGSGTFSWTGPVTLTGNTTITGTLAVKGVTTLSNNLIVDSAGKITVSGGSSPATLQNGALKFGTGGTLEADTTNGGIRLYVAGGGSVYAGSGAAQLGIGANTLIATSSGITVFGPLIASGIFRNTGITTTTSSANVYVDPTTSRFYYNTSARRFKIRPRKMKIAPALLDVPVKEWIDRGARERGEPDIHVPGIIAEEVDAAGGGQFITHGPDGELAGVAYDRLALARTQLLNEKLEAAMKRIEKLEAKLAAQP